MRAHRSGQGTLSITSTSIVHPTYNNIREGIQQLWEVIWCGKIQLCKLEETGARLRDQSERLEEEIDNLQLEVMHTGYAKELMKGSDVAGSPTLLHQATTPLGWLRLHLEVLRCINHNSLLESREHKGCLQPRLVEKWKTRMMGAPT